MPRNATTSIKRPTQRAAADEGRSKLGDLTGRIPVERRLWHGRRIAAVGGVFVLAIIATITVAVFVLPIGTWQDQGEDIVEYEEQLAELRRVNAELEAETTRLQTDDGVREAAREDYGYVEVGEERQSVLPFPALPTDLPDGWPYNVVTQIVDATAAGPAPTPTAAPATTTAPAAD